MEIIRGRKIPGNATFLSETFEIKLSDADLAEDVKALPLSKRAYHLAWAAEKALYVQMAVSEYGLTAAEAESWVQSLKTAKESLPPL